MKKIDVIREKFSKKPVFSLTEVKRYVNNSYQLINYLIKRGEVTRITKGYYTFKKDIMVVGYAFFSYYYGLYEALSLKELFEQETNPIIITPRKVRQGIRTFLGNNYLIKRINRRMFFGFELIKYYDFYIFVSDVEKTFIDFIYFRMPLDEETVANLVDVIEKRKLNNYLKRCSTWLKKRVLATMKKYG